MNKKKLIFCIAAVVLCIAAVTGTLLYRQLRRDPHRKDLLLSLPFDEGSGTVVSDASGSLPDKEVNYVFSHAAYLEQNLEPEWRKQGISGSCLLFDGYSTYINYSKNDISIEGDTFSVSVWVAPRTFEWDDPNAAETGNDSLTGIVCQSNKSKNQGFLLGYQRFGRLSFQVGIGNDWLTVWSNGDNLKKYEWNFVTATFDSNAGEMCLYLNGELVASRSVPAGAQIAHAKNMPLLVGRNGETERLTAAFLNVHSGLMDELNLYRCALTPEEVASYYSKAKISEIDFQELWLQNLLTDDIYRPQYHGGPYQNWMNEPHAPIYYNGTYHLFFQENMSGPYWKNICWGHLVSTDMVTWTPVKEAITPTEYSVVPDGVWSGGAAYDANGVPLLFFTAGNDSFSSVEGLISNQNIGIAYPADLSDPNLTEWIIYDQLAIAQQPGEGRTGEFRDPHIWKEGDTWCMVICSGSTAQAGGTALLYTTNRLELLPDGTIDMDWNYAGCVYEMENQSMLYGTSWELPIILPVSNEAGTVTRYLFLFSPAPASIADNKIYYFIGDFDLKTGKFTPDTSFQDTPHMLDYGCNVFTGPSAFTDPVSGDIYLFSIMQDQRSAAEQGAAGWAHNVGIARKLWLNEDGTDLKMSPADALHNLEDQVLVDQSNLSVTDANKLLAAVSADMLYINLVIDAKDALSFGINIKKGGTRDCTTFAYDAAKELISGETKNKGAAASTNYVSGVLPLENGKLSIELYIDRSLVEAFFNNTKSISMRAYTDDPASLGMDIFADGDIMVERLYVASMKSIY